MRIAPRTLLCSNAFRRFHPDLSTRFDELRELCMEAGDKASLAIGMAGLVMEHVLHGRIFEAPRQASEQMALVESVGDTTLTLGVTGAACVAKLQSAEMADVLRWTQVAIELADGDAASANFMLRSPLATALVFRGFARCCMGREGWREDMDTAMAIARTAGPLSLAMTINYKYATITRGVLMADDAAVTGLTEAVQIAERCSEDLPLVVLRMTLGTALTYRDSAGRERGVAMLAELRDTCIKERYGLNMVPTLELYIARTTADEDIDRAIQQTRAALEELYGWGNFANCDGGTRFLVQLLLARGTENDFLEAEAAIHRLVGTLAGSEWVTRDLFVLQLRALLARARGDDIGYLEHRDRYRAMANELGFEGHMQWAREMP